MGITSALYDIQGVIGEMGLIKGINTVLFLMHALSEAAYPIHDTYRTIRV